MTPSGEHYLRLIKESCVTKPSILSKFMQSTTSKLRSLLNTKDNIENTTNNAVNQSAPAEINPIIIGMGTLPSPTLTERHMMHDIPMLHVQIWKEPESITDINYIGSMVPTYSAETHTTSLEEILSNKSL